MTPTPSTTEIVPLSAVELDARAGDGLEVTLWWDRATGGVWVDVRGRSGRSWAVAAAPERARDMFHHPFAYGADEPNLEDVPQAA